MYVELTKEEGEMVRKSLGKNTGEENVDEEEERKRHTERV